MLKIRIEFDGVDSVGARVNKVKEFEGAPSKVFHLAEYYWFEQRALIAGVEIEDVKDHGSRE